MQTTFFFSKRQRRHDSGDLCVGGRLLEKQIVDRGSWCTGNALGMFWGIQCSNLHRHIGYLKLVRGFPQPLQVDAGILSCSKKRVQLKQRN
jgi:hypothetical protein